MYDNAHDVNPTQEDIKATQTLHNDPTILKKLQDNEDKK